MSTPTKLSHVVLQTNRVAALRDFYVRLLNARVQAEVATMCLLTFDEEHHRIALVNLEPLADRVADAAGLHHVAFTYASLEELLGNYERLKQAGELPWFCVNHGPTVSLYYRDPDGNQIELQVDVFDTVEETNAFIASPTYQRNPVGVEFDPEDMLARLRAGAPAEELMRRTD